MKNKTFKHFLITRFNVRAFPQLDHSHYNSSEWLEHRYRIFLDYCFPSVKFQINQDFIWLVCFDKDIPEKYKEINDYLNQDYKTFKPVYLEGFNSENLWGEIKEKISNEELLVTSRLDNDDALHPDYIVTMQDNIKKGVAPFYINILHGFNNNIKANKVYFIRNYHTNPFLTFVEPTKENFKGVYSIGHDSIRKSIYAKRIVNINKTGWLLCIHDKNVSNQNVGIRIKKKNLRGFILPGSYSFAEPDSSYEFWKERINQICLRTIYKFKVFVKKNIRRYKLIQK